MTAHVAQANGLHLPLRENSVDLVVTSPPYFGLRSYTDDGAHMEDQIGAEATPAEFVDALLAVTRECVRVLKPSGSLWVNLGDAYFSGKGAPGKTTVDVKNAGRTARRAGGNALDGPSFGVQRKSLVGLPWRYALRCIDDLGLILRAEVIWSKPNGLPESVTDRVRRSHEQWFHFTLEPLYFSAIDTIREEYAPATADRYAAGYKQPRPASAAGQTANGVLRLDGNGPSNTNPLGKLPGSVWTVPTQPLRVPAELGVDHFAAFPMEWPRRIILGWSPSGGTVLDPFGGTGTTATVATALGRTGLSFDLSHDYSRVARWRTTDPKQLARAVRLPKAKPAPVPPALEVVQDDQPTLFPATLPEGA